MAKLVLKEHIERGIEKYNGQPDLHLQQLLNTGKMAAEVFRFEDGRYLVLYTLMDQAFLYDSKEELLDKIQLD
ncbi:MAG: hypothetical protein COA58_08580 [Bacteroidetes bacterium]|nr:MAG: hypothetical protein COA58_08580 [Bacteroidota bacterium]